MSFCKGRLWNFLQAGRMDLSPLMEKINKVCLVLDLIASAM